MNESSPHQSGTRPVLLISFVPVDAHRFEIQGADAWNRFRCLGFVAIMPQYDCEGAFTGQIKWAALDEYACR